jgi:hypothetical protein
MTNLRKSSDCFLYSVAFLTKSIIPVRLWHPGTAGLPKPQVEAIGEVVVLMTGAALVVGFLGALIAGRGGRKVGV